MTDVRRLNQRYQNPDNFYHLERITPILKGDQVIKFFYTANISWARNLSFLSVYTFFESKKNNECHNSPRRLRHLCGIYPKLWWLKLKSSHYCFFLKKIISKTSLIPIKVMSEKHKFSSLTEMGFAHLLLVLVHLKLLKCQEPLPPQLFCY